jgi:hypothetical protein
MVAPLIKISKIEKAQKKAVQSITKSKYNAHTAELFLQTQIMPFKKMITFQQNKLVHSIYHKYSPEALHTTWTTVGARNNA